MYCNVKVGMLLKQRRRRWYEKKKENVNLYETVVFDIYVEYKTVKVIPFKTLSTSRS